MYNRFLFKQPKSSWLMDSSKKKLGSFFFYLVLITAFGLSFNWQMNLAIADLYTKTTQGLNEPKESVKSAYANLLSNSQQSAEILLFEGISLLKKSQTELGLIALEQAVKKDPYWRDAALYTGYTFLKENQNAPFDDQNYMDKAKFYLEKASNLDPLYPKTYQYLAVLYAELGDRENSQLSQTKAQDFSKTSW